MKLKFPIFKNKKSNDKQPDYRLSYKVGEEWFNCVSVYINKSKNGDEYLSVTLDTDLIQKYQNRDQNSNYRTENSSKHGKKILLKNEPKAPKDQEVMDIDPSDLPF